MLKIDIRNQKIVKAVIGGSSVELLADLGGIIDYVINKVSENEETGKEELLDELITYVKEVWKESNEGGQADA